MVSECIAKLEERWKAGKYVCVGLDSDFSLLPQVLRAERPSPEEALFVFNREIVDATADSASAFKINSAFYEAEGDQGWRALKRTADYLKEHYPEIPLILDAKRADIGNTNSAYTRAIFDDLQMDAVTVHPYLGGEALTPFLERKDKAIFVLVKTSNQGSGEFQDLAVGESKEPLYKVVARAVSEKWNANSNCGVVVGATYPEELKAVREIVGEMPILIPGIGAQGGDIEKTIQAGKAQKSFGMVIAVSRSIIFASSGEDYAKAAGTAALALGDEIQKSL